jgi:hypothetical protein
VALFLLKPTATGGASGWTAAPVGERHCCTWQCRLFLVP